MSKHSLIMLNYWLFPVVLPCERLNKNRVDKYWTKFLHLCPLHHTAFETLKSMQFRSTQSFSVFDIVMVILFRRRHRSIFHWYKLRDNLRYRFHDYLARLDSNWSKSTLIDRSTPSWRRHTDRRPRILPNWGHRSWLTRLKEEVITCVKNLFRLNVSQLAFDLLPAYSQLSK